MEWTPAAHPIGPYWIADEGELTILQLGSKFLRFTRGQKGVPKDQQYDSLKDAMEASA